jgi:hypothetical protein
MSHGPGRVERAIGRQFADHPDKAFTTGNLASAVYPDKPIGRNQRFAVARAAPKVAARLNWFYLDHKGVWVRGDCVVEYL